MTQNIVSILHSLHQNLKKFILFLANVGSMIISAFNKTKNSYFTGVVESITWPKPKTIFVLKSLDEML